jgi:hypothetical protein
MTADPIREAVARALTSIGIADPDWAEQWAPSIDDAGTFLEALEVRGYAVVPKEAAGLGEAWRAVEEALPAKRWTISLAGDWEAGWVADAAWRLVGGPSSSATTREHRWGEEDQGLDTPEAALRALAARLAEQGEP